MFKRTVRDSRYRERPLMKKFKREMDRRIRRWLMETEYPSKSINSTKEQQYQTGTIERVGERKKKKEVKYK